MVNWLRTPLSRAEVAGYLVFVAGFALLVATGVWHYAWVQYGSILMAVGTGIAGRGQATRNARGSR